MGSRSKGPYRGMRRLAVRNQDPLAVRRARAAILAHAIPPGTKARTLVGNALGIAFRMIGAQIAATVRIHVLCLRAWVALVVSLATPLWLPVWLLAVRRRGRTA